MPTVTYQRRTPEQSVLYNAVRKEWPAVRAMARQANLDRGLPAFIESAAESFLRCGILRHGFVKAVCHQCNKSLVVAFSCKQRGICNSCDGKRMTEVAAHWLDEVIAPVPIRQWVITFPFDLRYLLAWNAPLRSAVLGAFMRALQAHYQRQALAHGGQAPKYGAISVDVVGGRWRSGGKCGCVSYAWPVWAVRRSGLWRRWLGLPLRVGALAGTTLGCGRRMMKALLYLLTLPLMLLDGLLHFLRMGGVTVVAVRADTRSPQLVHLWHERSLSGTRYSDGSSEDLRVFGHVALHLGTWKLTNGLSQRGIKLELDSPFALRSLQHVGRKLGLPVELGPDAKAPKGCPLVIHEGEPGATVPVGPVVTVHKWDVDGGAESVSGEMNVLRYVRGGQIRWSKRGHNVWLRNNHVYAGLNGTAWVLYRGMDLRVLAWRLDTDEVLADRYLIGGLL